MSLSSTAHEAFAHQNILSDLAPVRASGKLPNLLSYAFRKQTTYKG